MPGGNKQNKFACERDEGARGIPVGGPRVSPPSNYLEPTSHAQASGGVSVQQGQPSRSKNSEDASGVGGQGEPRTSANPSYLRNLTPRAVAALAFIAVENAHRRFPRGCEIGRFLNLPHKRQSARVVEELMWNRYVERTDRGLEVRIP